MSGTILQQRLKKNFLVLVASMAAILPAGAQDSRTGNWWTYFGNLQLSDQWNFWHEVQYRNYNVAGDLEQLLLRGGIGYDLTPGQNNLLLGYAFIRSRNYIGDTDSSRVGNENRIYQQWLTRLRFGRFYVSHRYRLEERFRQMQVDVRGRYFLGLNLPVTKPDMTPGAVYLSLYNEIFLNVGQPAFDRNRMYAGAGLVLSAGLRGELGFMRQQYERGGRNQFQVVLFNSLRLRRPDAD